MKGISPLLAAVILVALTISIAFIASSSISTLTQRQVSTATQQGSASSNVLEVKEASCIGTNISFIAKNIGPQSITGITIAYKVGNATGEYKMGTSSDSAFTLDSGELKEKSIDVSSVAASPTNITYLQVCSQSPAGVCVEKTSASDFNNNGVCS